MIIIICHSNSNMTNNAYFLFYSYFILNMYYKYTNMYRKIYFSTVQDFSSVMNEISDRVLGMFLS